MDRKTLIEKLVREGKSTRTIQKEVRAAGYKAPSFTTLRKLNETVKGSKNEVKARAGAKAKKAGPSLPPKPKKPRKPPLPKVQRDKTFMPMGETSGNPQYDTKYAYVVGYRYKDRDGKVPTDHQGFSSYVTIISDSQLSDRQIKQRAHSYIEKGIVSDADNRYNEIKQYYPSTLTITERYYDQTKVSV